MNARFIRLNHTEFINVIADFFQLIGQVIVGVENLYAYFMHSPTEMGFQNLPDVHTRRYAQRIQHDLNGSTVR